MRRDPHSIPPAISPSSRLQHFPLRAPKSTQRQKRNLGKSDPRRPRTSEIKRPRSGWHSKFASVPPAQVLTCATVTATVEELAKCVKFHWHSAQPEAAE
jgi:hypothetical protein